MPTLNQLIQDSIRGLNATQELISMSTSKKYDYPPLVSNVGWLGLLSVARLGGQRALGCGGAIFAQPPNLMRHRVRTAGNRSMGGTSNPFAAARLANRTQQARRPLVRRRPVLETAAAAGGVNDRTCCNLGITRQLFRSIGIGGA
ncbi:hypothetical protein GOBAR_AA34242 [Gossypium barbadense]|uniref:Uncharacterized protein n=1 Tax=Gossypium barbadense TaxID=3634 RepID=A0A2P5W5X0_GOSBA|nr:hypothetical protein GOBAR_AA34242 [Gossypium barbadense]